MRCNSNLNQTTELVQSSKISPRWHGPLCEKGAFGAFLWVLCIVLQSDWQEKTNRALLSSSSAEERIRKFPYLGVHYRHDKRKGGAEGGPKLRAPFANSRAMRAILENFGGTRIRVTEAGRSRGVGWLQQVEKPKLTLWIEDAEMNGLNSSAPCRRIML
jgi:hypothetical protein